MLKLSKPYALLSIIIVVLTVYYSTIFAEVLYIDDQKMIETLLNRDHFNLKGEFFRGRSYYYRPLNTLTYLADKYIWNLQESFMHLENTLLHVFNSCLVYLIATRIARKHFIYSSTVPLVASMLFALHPIATEPVNWISGRTDLLAGSFILSALLFLLRNLDSGSRGALILSAILFFIATLAKETALFWFPAALFLIYVCSEEGRKQFPKGVLASLRPYAIQYGALSIVPVAYLALRYFSFGKHDSGIKLAINGITSSNDHLLLDKVRISLKVLGYYTKKIFIPIPLDFATTSLSDWYISLGVLFVIIFIYLVWRRSINSSLLLMSVCILSPALFVPLGKMALTPVAERYLYMPSAFFAVAITVSGATAVHRYSINKNLVSALVLVILFVAGYFTWQRNLVWQTNLSFFQDAVRQNPQDVSMKTEFAKALIDSGRESEGREIFTTLKLKTSDNYYVATEINKANILAAKGDYFGAVKLLKNVKCADSDPFYKTYLQSRMYMNSKLMAEMKNKIQIKQIQIENIDLLEKLQKRSGDPYLYYRLGQLCLSVNEKARAAAFFRLAAEKSPYDAFYKDFARRLADKFSK